MPLFQNRQISSNITQKQLTLKNHDDNSKERFLDSLSCFSVI